MPLLVARAWCTAIAIAGSCIAMSAVARTSHAAEPSAPMRLVYERARAEQCPDETTLRNAIRTRLGYDPFRDGAQPMVHVVMKRSASTHFEAHVETRDAFGHVQGTRDLTSTSSDCLELVNAIAVAVAIAIDPLQLTKPPSEPAVSPPVVTLAAPSGDEDRAPPPQAPEPLPSVGKKTEPVPHAPRPKIRAGAGSFLAVGRAPAANFGLGVLVGVRWPVASINLEGAGTLPGSRSVSSGGVDNIQINASLLSIAAAPCLHRSLFAVCAVGMAGALEGGAHGALNAHGDVTPFVAAGGRIEGEIPVAASLLLRAYVDGLATIAHTTLRIDEQPVWETPPLSATFGMAAMTYF